MAAQVTQVPSGLLDEALAEAAVAGRHMVVEPKQLAAVLAEVPLFASLGKRDLRRLAGCAKVCHYAAGDRIVREGFSAEGFFVLLSGEVEVVHGERLLARVERGGFFGEIGLLDGLPRIATVVASCDLWALRVPHEAFIALVREHPDVAIGLLRELCGRLRRYGEPD
jgi:CRP-like cAMP-binding protein